MRLVLYNWKDQCDLMPHNPISNEYWGSVEKNWKKDMDIERFDGYIKRWNERTYWTYPTDQKPWK